MHYETNMLQMTLTQDPLSVNIAVNYSVKVIINPQYVSSFRIILFTIIIISISFMFSLLIITEID